MVHRSRAAEHLILGVKVHQLEEVVLVFEMIGRDTALTFLHVLLNHLASVAVSEGLVLEH